MAFGTGTHETTRLCLQILDEAIGEQPPTSVLDVGCGSGILSIAAVGLGVEQVVGVDVDETAVEIARENLKCNSKSGSAHFSTTPLPRLGTFEVVVANILAHILEELADDLQDRVAQGGTLIASGITTDQADAFLERFRVDELRLVDRHELGEWVAFVFARP
jgi:ribosomal protein L11 methyltransferase